MGNRNDYLVSLNKMRSNYQNNGNPLINTQDDTTNVGEELSSFAYMQTNLPTMTPNTTTEYKESRNGWQRAWDTVGSFISDTNRGVANWVDSVFDFLVYEGGQLAKHTTGKWFDIDTESVTRKIMDFNWQDYYMGVMDQLDFGTNFLNGNGMDGTWLSRWEDIGDPNKVRENEAKMRASSFESDMSAKSQNTYNQVKEGIGEALPTIAIAIATGGQSIPAQMAIQGGLAYASGKGRATSQALQEGADFDKAGLYGTTKGVVSGLTTAATVGIGGAATSKMGSGLTGQLSSKIGNAIGSKATTVAGQKALTTVAGKSSEILMRAGIQSLSAAANTALDPVLKEIYDDKAIEKAYGSEVARSETWQRCRDAMATAAIISIGSSVGREAASFAKAGSWENYTNQYMNQQSVIYAKKYEKMSRDMNQELVNAKSPEQRIAIYDKYTTRFERFTKQYSVALEQTENMSKLIGYGERTNKGLGITERNKELSTISNAKDIQAYIDSTNIKNKAMFTALFANPDFRDQFQGFKTSANERTANSDNVDVDFTSNDGTKLLTFKQDGTGMMTVKGNTPKSSYSLPIRITDKGQIQAIATDSATLSTILNMPKNNGFKFDGSFYLKKDTLNLPSDISSSKINKTDGLTIDRSVIEQMSSETKDAIVSYFETLESGKGSRVVYKDEKTGGYKVVEIVKNADERKIAIIDTDKAFSKIEDIKIVDQNEAPITTTNTGEIKIDNDEVVALNDELPKEQQFIPLDNEVNVKLHNNEPFTLSNKFVWQSENEDKQGQKLLQNYLELANKIPSANTYYDSKNKVAYQVTKNDDNYLTYKYDLKTKELLSIEQTKSNPTNKILSYAVARVSSLSDKDVNSSARFISAKGHLEKEKVISLGDTKEAVKEFVPNIAKIIAGEDGDVVFYSAPSNKELFAVLNAGSDEQVGQALDNYLTKIMNVGITWNKGTENEFKVDLLKDYAPQEIERFKGVLKTQFIELLNSKMQPSKISKIIDEINNTVDKMNDYRKRVMQSNTIRKKTQKIIDKIEKEKIYGLNEKENEIKHNVLKLAKLTRTKGAVYSGSNKEAFHSIAADTDFMNSLEGDQQLYANGKEVADLIRAIANTYDENLNARQKPFTYDELELVDKFIEESYKAFDYSTKTAEKVREYATAVYDQLDFAIANQIKSHTNNSFKNAVEYISDPALQLIRIAGSRESELYKKTYGELVTKASNILRDETKLARQFKASKPFNYKISRKEDVKLDSFGYKVSQQHLEYLYAQMLVEENKTHLQGTGSIELGRGKSKRIVDIKFSEKLLKEVETKITPKAKERAIAVHDLLNNVLKPYLKENGVEVIDDYMFEITNRLIRSTNMTELGGKSYSVKSNNLKARTNNQLPAHISTLEGNVDRIIHSVVTEINMNDALREINYLMNLDLGENGEVRSSVGSKIEGLEKGGSQFVRGLVARFVGVDPNKMPEKIPVIDYVTNQIMASKVGLNFFSTALKQPVSIMYAFETLDVGSFIRALPKFVKSIGHSFEYTFNKGQVSGDLSEIFEESGLLMTRGDAAIKSTDLNENGGLNAVRKVVGVSMALPDMMTVMQLTYAAMEQSKAAGYTGRAYIDNTVHLVEEVLQRQVNNYAWNTSRLQHNPVAKFIASFKSQGRSITTAVGEYLAEVSFVKGTEKKATENYEAAKGKLDEANERVNQAGSDEEKTKAEQEKAKAEREFKKAESVFNQVNDTKAKLGKRGGAVLTMLIGNGIGMSLIPLLTNFLYGKKNEKTGKDIAKDIAYNTFVSWIPVVSNIADMFYKNYDSNNLLMEGWEDAVEIKNLIENLKDDPSEQDIYKVINKTAILVSTMFGIPLENIEKQLFGIAKRFNMTEVIKFQNLLYGYSSSYLYSQVKSLKESDPKEAQTDLSSLMTLYKTGTSDDEVNAEIVRLWSIDREYYCMPTDTLKTYTNDNGDEVKLNDFQRQEFKNIYSQSTDVVKELLNISEYKSANDYNKAKMIKSVYSAYYQYAKYQAIGKQPTTKVGKLLTMSKGKIGITKLLIGVNALSSIEATKTNTKKELVVKQINSMRSYNRNEKLLLLYLSGYSVSDENKKILQKYLIRNGMTRSEANDFLK